MREIKFRAWDKNTKIMIHWDDLVKSRISFRNFRWALLSENSENFELMQYTGLKDKNGVEIYEGDIIRCSTRTINGSIFTHVCRVFQYESGTWMIEGHHEDNPSYKTKGTVYAAHLICEVIGNIYENPELAK